MGGESELVKDVIFVRLDDEEDAEGKRGVGFGGAVSLMCAGKAEGEGLGGRAWWEGVGRYERRNCGRIGVYGEKVTVE